MALSAADLEDAMVDVTLPTDPAALAAARGDNAGQPAPEPAKEAATEPAAKELTDAEKAEVEAVVKPESEAAKPEAEPEAREPERGPDGKFIPKARFDELRQKKDAKIETLEARLRAATEQLRVKEGPATVQEAETALEVKVEEYQELLADGKLKEAKAVFKEVSKLNRQIAQLEMAPVLQDLTAASANASAVDEVIDLYTSEFPEFLTGSTLHNQELVNQVAELQAGYEATGHSPATALRKAADMVVRAAGLKPWSERKASKVEPAEDKGAKRKTEAVQANLAAAKGQPPGLSSVGIDSDKIGASKLDFSTLTPDEFAKLPEATIKRARGDLL